MGKRKVSIFSVFVLIVGLSGLGVGVFSLYNHQQLVNQLESPKPLGRMNLSASYAISGGAWHTVDFNVEDFDRANNFNIVTNRFICPFTGYYLVTAMLTFVIVNDGEAIFVAVVKGITTEAANAAHASQTNSLSVGLTDVIYLIAGEYLELQAYHTGGTDRSIHGSVSGAYTYLTVAAIGI